MSVCWVRDGLQFLAAIVNFAQCAVEESVAFTDAGLAQRHGVLRLLGEKSRNVGARFLVVGHEIAQQCVRHEQRLAARGFHEHIVVEQQQFVVVQFKFWVVAFFSDVCHDALDVVQNGFCALEIQQTRFVKVNDLLQRTADGVVAPDFLDINAFIDVLEFLGVFEERFRDDEMLETHRPKVWIEHIQPGKRLEFGQDRGVHEIKNRNVFRKIVQVGVRRLGQLPQTFRRLRKIGEHVFQRLDLEGFLDDDLFAGCEQTVQRQIVVCGERRGFFNREFAFPGNAPVRRVVADVEHGCNLVVERCRLSLFPDGLK